MMVIERAAMNAAEEARRNRENARRERWKKELNYIISDWRYE